MSIEIRPIEERDIESFHLALDSVARERKYLQTLAAPSVERIRSFVSRNIQKGYPQIVAIQDGELIG